MSVDQQENEPRRFKTFREHGRKIKEQGKNALRAVLITGTLFGNRGAIDQTPNPRTEVLPGAPYAQVVPEQTHRLVIPGLARGEEESTPETVELNFEEFMVNLQSNFKKQEDRIITTQEELNTTWDDMRVGSRKTPRLEQGEAVVFTTRGDENSTATKIYKITKNMYGYTVFVNDCNINSPTANGAFDSVLIEGFDASIPTTVEHSNLGTCEFSLSSGSEIATEGPDGPAVTYTPSSLTLIPIANTEEVTSP